jgi:hypothetical protein
MLVRRLRRGEGAVLRDVRLRALADSPDAFASSLAEETPHPAARWQAYADANEAAKRSVTIVAEERDECVGMAVGLRSDQRAGIAELAAMWVDHRGRR